MSCVLASCLQRSAANDATSNTTAQHPNSSRLYSFPSVTPLTWGSVQFVREPRVRIDYPQSAGCWYCTGMVLSSNRSHLLLYLLIRLQAHHMTEIAPSVRPVCFEPLRISRTALRRTTTTFLATLACCVLLRNSSLVQTHRFPFEPPTRPHTYYTASFPWTTRSPHGRRHLRSALLFSLQFLLPFVLVSGARLVSVRQMSPDMVTPAGLSLPPFLALLSPDRSRRQLGAAYFLDFFLLGFSSLSLRR